MPRGNIPGRAERKAASPSEDLAASVRIQQANSFLALDLLTATEHFMETIAPASAIGPSAIHNPPQLQQHMTLPSLGKESDHAAFPGTTGAEGLSTVAPHNSNAVLYLPVMEDSQVDQQTNNNNNIISALTRSSKQGELASAVDAFPELGSTLHGSHREGKGVGGPFTAVPLEGDVISPIERPIAREDSGVVCVIPVAPWGVSLEGIETAQSTGTAAAPWDITPTAELLQHFVQHLPQRQQKKKKHVNPPLAAEEELKKKALRRARRNSCHTKNMNGSTESSLFPLHRCKTLHLVRHAQGVHNLEGDKDHKAYSSPNFFDAELTPLGWNQVDNLRKHVNTCGIAKKIELVIVSPLLRTMQTAVGAFGGESLKDGLSVPPLMVENAGNCGLLAISSLNCPPFIALEFCRERMVFLDILFYLNSTKLILPRLVAVTFSSPLFS